MGHRLTLQNEAYVYCLPMVDTGESNIDYYRKLAGLTIDELAAKSGLSPGYIKQIKSRKAYGDRKPRRLNEDVAKKIAKALGNCSPGDLLDKSDGLESPSMPYEHEQFDAYDEIIMGGDYMSPTLHDGDVITLDTSKRTLSDGIYALRFGGQVLVRRVQLNPVTGRISLMSDNKAYEPMYDIDPATVDIVGRAIKQTRNL